MYKQNGCRVAQLVEQTPEVGKGNVSPDFQSEGRRFESGHGNKETNSRCITKKGIIMKKCTKDFFEAIGFEDGDDVKSMLRQTGFGMVIGIALIAVLALGELFNTCV